MRRPVAAEQVESIRHVLMVGDLAGPAQFHVGDEAMLACNLSMLRRLLPNARFTLLSRDPSASATRYAADALCPPGFAEVSADRRLELGRIDTWQQQAEVSPEHLPASLQALLEADLLIISGGGNLSSSWPEHILDRLALVRIARQRRIPVLIFGQTLGPNLTAVDRELVAEILDSAAWVGVREAPSLALAVELGLEPSRIDFQLDDAMGLLSTPCDLLQSAWPAARKQGPLIALTLHPQFLGETRACWLDALTIELDRVVAELDARLLFIPHCSDWKDGQDEGDRSVGLALRERLQRPSALHVLPVQDAAQTAWLTRQADLVVSSRYHPLIFALAESCPCLGLACDSYTLIKLQGALAHAGLDSELLVMRARRWDGLAQVIIQRCRCPVQPVPAWQVRLDGHIRERERRLADWLERRQQGLPTPAPGYVDDGRLAALAHLLSGTAQAHQVQARELELQASVDYWQDSAQAAQHYVQDLHMALQRQADERRRLHETLESTIRRAELAEQYAHSLELERRLADWLELQASVDHWKDSAQAAQHYALDLHVALQRQADEHLRLHEALESTICRAELAEQYAYSLELERQRWHEQEPAGELNEQCTAPEFVTRL
ncbi:polysaccharide pyruvyl transferase WcaK-like protein/predicted nucleic acid-binding Zn-ribbon protein [Pseudomonas fluvialis]|uniref:Polysaccharide pyruvyl transferase WcaK-like protein/predicted nucleic acid-binding Zn-ribbon protein n=1 Tax=Pseudomonas fluvialis TaxID=1793966 RepID=A0A7X0BR28_9PSED|nr:polysaccharide pyruvyl transferase family protein [Pseudomonas fluvialis]MBB6340741.1 polysaccharide pyruvyl transferase WcaK-like protein/predicted nucleic acid-binding Zn-ribbon protein [Pseudomonas fluvialis]